jgi:hypothetical protein
VWLYPCPEDFSAHPLLLNRIFTYTTGRNTAVPTAQSWRCGSTPAQRTSPPIPSSSTEYSPIQQVLLNYITRSHTMRCCAPGKFWVMRSGMEPLWIQAVWRIRDVYPRSRILICTHPGSRIQKQQGKSGVKKKFVVIPFFWSHKFHKVELFYF